MRLPFNYEVLMKNFALNCFLIFGVCSFSFVTKAETTASPEHSASFYDVYKGAFPDFRIEFLSPSLEFAGLDKDELSLSDFKDEKTYKDPSLHQKQFKEVNSIFPKKYFQVSICDSVSLNVAEKAPTCIDLKEFRPERKTLTVFYVTAYYGGDLVGPTVGSFQMRYLKQNRGQMSLREGLGRALSNGISPEKAVLRLRIFAREDYRLSNMNQKYGVFGYTGSTGVFGEEIIRPNPIENSEVEYRVVGERFLDPFQLNIDSPSTELGVSVSASYVAYNEIYSNYNLPTKFVSSAMINGILKRELGSEARVLDFFLLSVFAYSTLSEEGWGYLKQKQNALEVDWGDPRLVRLRSLPLLKKLTKSPVTAEYKLELLAQYAEILEVLQASIQTEMGEKRIQQEPLAQNSTKKGPLPKLNYPAESRSKLVTQERLQGFLAGYVITSLLRRPYDVSRSPSAPPPSQLPRR